MSTAQWVRSRYLLPGLLDEIKIEQVTRTSHRHVSVLPLECDVYERGFSGHVRSVVIPAMSEIGADPVRTSVRFPMQLEVVLSTPGREYKAVTQDVSANGVLFVGEELPPVDSRVKFRLTMPASVMGGQEDVVLHCLGRIVRRTESDGRMTAAAVIDEYSLKAEQV